MSLTKTITSLSAFVFLSCSTESRSQIHTTVRFDNQLDSKVVLNISTDQPYSYVIPAKTTQSILHVANADKGDSYSVFSVVLEVHSDAGNRIARFLGHDRYGAEQTLEQFPDGKSGLSNLEITCNNEACVLNGKTLQK